MALIWVGLMYSTYAGWPFIVTDTPSNAVGRLLPEKSDEVHEREELVKPVPTIETNPPDAIAGRSLAALTTEFKRDAGTGTAVWRVSRMPSHGPNVTCGAGVP